MPGIVRLISARASQTLRPNESSAVKKLKFLMLQVTETEIAFEIKRTSCCESFAEHVRFVLDISRVKTAVRLV